MFPLKSLHAAQNPPTFEELMKERQQQHRPRMKNEEKNDIDDDRKKLQHIFMLLNLNECATEARRVRN